MPGNATLGADGSYTQNAATSRRSFKALPQHATVSVSMVFCDSSTWQLYSRSIRASRLPAFSGFLRHLGQLLRRLNVFLLLVGRHHDSAPGHLFTFETSERPRIDLEQGWALATSFSLLPRQGHLDVDHRQGDDLPLVLADLALHPRDTTMGSALGQRFERC